LGHYTRHGTLVTSRERRSRGVDQDAVGGPLGIDKRDPSKAIEADLLVTHGRLQLLGPLLGIAEIHNRVHEVGQQPFPPPVTDYRPLMVAHTVVHEQARTHQWHL